MTARTKFAALQLVVSPAISSFAADLSIPRMPGMSWNYKMTQELGQGVKFSDLKPDPDGKFRARVIYRLDGMEKLDGKDHLKLEMHRAGVITNTDLISVDERGVACVARIDLNGELVRLNPPQVIVGALHSGTSWDFDSGTGSSKVHQHYQITGEEEVEVPAGKFRAFHIHGDQTSPSLMKIDRWFVNGTGIVKDVTEVRTEGDELLRRISLELEEEVKITARPEVKPFQAPTKLTASLGKQAVGAAVVNFTSDTPKIYARWYGHALRDQAKIRAVWIAENIAEDAPPDYTVDQATAIATSPDSRGVFTLSRPDNGWTPGNYRVEFYVDDALADTVKMTIGK